MFLFEISEIYVGAATDETPIAIPPINLKKEKVYGSCAKAEPIADAINITPNHINTFLRPYFSVGAPANTEPITVPHKAIDIIKNP